MKTGQIHRWKKPCHRCVIRLYLHCRRTHWSVRVFDSVLIVCVWVRALHTHVLASSSELCSECICAYCSQTLVSNVCPCCSFVQHRKRVCVCCFHVLFCAFSVSMQHQKYLHYLLCRPNFVQICKCFDCFATCFSGLCVYPTVCTCPLSISW